MGRCYTVPADKKHIPDAYKITYSFFIFCTFLTTDSTVQLWMPILSLLPLHSLNAPLLLHKQWCTISIICRSFIILQTYIVSLLISLLSTVNNFNLFDFSDICKLLWDFAHSHHPSTNSFSSDLSSQRSRGWHHIQDSGEVLSIA